MPAPIQGVGYLVVNDLLTDIAYSLIEFSVNQVLPSNIPSPGVFTVYVWDKAIYLGCQVVVGIAGANLEAVTVTDVQPGVAFTATFSFPHNSGEPVQGATFPACQKTNPFFTQPEMLGYLSQAVNDFLTECPLVIAISNAISVPPAAQNVSLPDDCMTPTRVAAFGIPLRETSQTNLEMMSYTWQQDAATGPYAYFRDSGVLSLGVYPRANNTTPLEIVYKQRSEEILGLADGFILPDPFLIFCKYRALEFAYSKDGEARSPGLAKYYNGRYVMGCKISNMFLGAVNDSSLQV